MLAMALPRGINDTNVPDNEFKVHREKEEDRKVEVDIFSREDSVVL